MNPKLLKGNGINRKSENKQKKENLNRIPEMTFTKEEDSFLDSFVGDHNFACSLTVPNELKAVRNQKTT